MGYGAALRSLFKAALEMGADVGLDAVCLGWRWLLCLPKARNVASVLVRLMK